MEKSAYAKIWVEEEGCFNFWNALSYSGIQFTKFFLLDALFLDISVYKGLAS